MRTVLAFLLLASVANAQLTRFVGTDKTRAWLQLKPERSSSYVRAELEGEWHLDVVTDGQSIQPGSMTWQFFSTAPLDHHFGQIEFQLDLLVDHDTPMDLNPIHWPEYTRQGHAKFDIDGDGHYRSLEFESDLNAIERTNAGSTDLYYGFQDWPNSLEVRDRGLISDWDEQRRETFPVNLYPLGIEVEPGLTLNALTIELPRVVLTAVDDPVAAATGGDLLAAQRGIEGRADFTYDLWAASFPAATASIGGVPEPSSWWLLVVSGAAFLWATRLSVRDPK